MRERYYTRRDALLGGLTFGAVLAGGLLFSGSSQMVQGASASGNRTTYLQLSLAWNGLDFAWLPDNARLAIASDDGLGVVKTNNGQLSRQNWAQIGSRLLQNSAPGTRAVYWSSNGTKALYATATGLLVLDVLTGRPVWSHSIEQASGNIAALSPDGTRLALPSKTGVQIWNVQEGKVIAQFGSALVAKSLLWSPDSTRIATTSQQGMVQVWQAADGRSLWSGISSPQQAISWSPDGKSIAFVASGTGGQAQLGLWNAGNGLVRFQTPALVGFLSDGQLKRDEQVAWSPDGSRVAFGVLAGSGSRIEVWSVSRGQRLFVCQSVSGQSSAPTWSPDGKYIAAGQTIVGKGELIGGDNGERSIIQFWDASTGRALFAYSAPKSPQRLTWSPDGHALALITPKNYGALATSTCLSFCRYGYNDYALEVFRVG
jgi:WD40 repeat protein